MTDTPQLCTKHQLNHGNKYPSCTQQDKKPWLSEELNDIIGDNIYHDKLAEASNPQDSLDDIMEDLITGHNFEYAREALIKWSKGQQLKAKAKGFELARALIHPDMRQQFDKTLAELEDKL